MAIPVSPSISLVVVRSEIFNVLVLPNNEIALGRYIYLHTFSGPKRYHNGGIEPPKNTLALHIEHRYRLGHRTVDGSDYHLTMDPIYGDPLHRETKGRSLFDLKVAIFTH